MSQSYLKFPLFHLQEKKLIVKREIKVYLVYNESLLHIMFNGFNCCTDIPPAILKQKCYDADNKHFKRKKHHCNGQEFRSLLIRQEENKDVLDSQIGEMFVGKYCNEKEE